MPVNIVLHRQKIRKETNTCKVHNARMRIIIRTGGLVGGMFHVSFMTTPIRLCFFV